MNFGELRTTTSYWLDDLAMGYFTPTQLNVWINNAHKEVQKRLVRAGQNFYTKTVQTSMVVGCRAYSLPLDFKMLHRLDIIITGTIPNETVISLTPITWNQQDLVARGPGTPTVYAIQKNKLVVFRSPDITYTMRLTYSPLVADMVNDSDLPDVPQDYVELIALLAAQDGFIKDARVSETLLNKIAAYEKDMDMLAAERRQDLSREVRETGDLSTNGTYYF